MSNEKVLHLRKTKKMCETIPKHTITPSIRKRKHIGLQKHITKSLFTTGKRCIKALYLSTYFPHLRPPISTLERKTLGAGRKVGQAARKVFPDGVLIGTLDTLKALDQTQQAIDAGALTIYETAFSYDNVLVRVDILSRDTVNDPWDFYEVKATTYHDCTKQQKEEYRDDIAIQVWVLQNLGIPLRKISLMHLNKECQFPDLENLFTYKDYSSEIIDRLSEMENYLHDMRNMLSRPEEPKTSIGPHCNKPRDCPFQKHCKKDIPKPSIFNIPRNLKKWRQYEEGVISTDDLIESDFNSEIQKRALKCYQDNRHFFDTRAVAELLNLWEYPLAYLDFEAIDYAIPRYSGARPYQHIPFQFSCHIQQTPEAELEHEEFLWSSPDDPRPAFIHELIAKVPSTGSIVVYHAPYESTRLKELAEDFPEFSEQLNDIKDRLVDLKVVIQKGVYYPEFMGSFSIKKVAPSILGESASYANLNISDGIEAMVAFDELVTCSPDSVDRQSLIDSMIRYCEQDTLLMVKLHSWLNKQFIIKKHERAQTSYK